MKQSFWVPQPCFDLIVLLSFDKPFMFKLFVYLRRVRRVYLLLSYLIPLKLNSSPSILNIWQPYHGY
jgi:hypothetical protein